MADGEADERKVLDAARQLPLPERGAHKNWKVRNELYEEVKEACGKASGPEDASLDVYGEQHPRPSLGR